MMGAGFVLLGVLCLCGLASGEGCNGYLRENWDYPGSDIAVLFSPDAEHCQHLCTQHSSCLFFAFIGPECTVDKRHFHCFLKSTRSGKPQHQGPKQGTTCGFSLRSCSPDPKPCLPEVYHNMDFYGSDFEALFTADYAECQRACTHNPACQFFTFVNGDFAHKKIRFKCHLKFSWPVPQMPTVVADANVVSGFSHKLQTPICSDKVCEGKLFPNTDYPGQDVVALPGASPEHCQLLCSAHPHCTYFSYVSKNFRCYLKRNPHHMDAKHVGGITSGLPARFCQLDNKWLWKPLTGINLPGADFHSFPVADADTCQKTCTEDSACQFYAFALDRRHCYHKRVITMPAPRKVTRLANAVSGFSLRNCQLKVEA